MNTALEITGLCKNYDAFALKNALFLEKEHLIQETHDLDSQCFILDHIMNLVSKHENVKYFLKIFLAGH